MNDKFLFMYKLLLLYIKDNNTTLVPQSYTVTYNGNTYNLGMWVNSIRKQYKKGTLSIERIALLNKVNFLWNVKDINKQIMSDKWFKMYNYAKEYYIINNNLEVPLSYEIILSNETIKLGEWVKNQRNRLKNKKYPLSIEQITLLKDIGMDFNKVSIIKSNTLFLKYYNLAKEYYNTYGNLLIREDYKVINGKEIINLGEWICINRFNYNANKLPKEQIDLLNSIGMEWDLSLNERNGRLLRKEMK